MSDFAKGTNVPANDCISRQEAIDFFNEVDKRFPHRVLRPEQARYILMRLPSAQPEIIRCKDCKHWRSNTEFCSTFTELNVAHRMPPNGFCSCAERREE